MKKIYVNSLEPSQEQLNSLLELYQTGKYPDAEKLSLSITQEFPEHQFAWKVLAAVLKQKSRISESLVAGQKSVQLNPQDAEAHSNLGVTLKELGKLDEAEASCRKAIALKLDYAEAHYNLGLTLKELGKLDEAEASYKKAIALKPNYAKAYNNLGVTLNRLGRLDEAEASYRQAIILKPDFAEALNNLGAILQELGRLDEAETICKKAIELKPDYAEGYNNLGVVLQKIGRLEEAESSCKKAIEFKSNYPQALNNLGAILQELGRLDEAEASYKKVLELKLDYTEAYSNLDLLFKRKELLVNISQAKKNEIKNNLKSANVSIVSSNLRLSPNPFISKREVERELFTDLYKMKTTELYKTKDARYGNGRCSDFKFLENELPIIKNIAEDLKKIMMQAVKSEIFIIDSFLNIYGAGSGTTPHTHTDYFDKSQGLVNQKYSLTYYLSVGDQNCSEPGNLKVYDPEEEILLSEGKIVILPSSRKHAAIYNGKKDRIMVGVNFYSLL